MKRNRIYAPCSLILLAGMIPATTASAQFVVEDKAHGTRETIVHDHDSRGEHTRERWSQTISTGDHVYELDFAGGVFVVKVDREQVPDSWIHKVNNQIQIINDDGKEIIVFQDIPTYRAMVVKPGENRVLPGDHDHSFAWTSGNGESPEQLVKVQVETPKVMLGINLSEPSAALRKHLGLGDREAILIDGVIDGLPAKKAGMEEFDVIISIDGSDEANGKILHEAMMKHEAGDTLKLIVLRAGEKLKLKPELQAYNGELLGAITMELRENQNGPGNTWFTNNDRDGKMQIQRFVDSDKDFPGRLELHKEMMDRAKEAYNQAERHILELRDGQLFVHENKIRDMKDHLEGLQHFEFEQLEGLREGAHERFAELEERLNTLEDQLEAQADRLEDRMEQLTGLLERMFEKMSEDDDD